MPAGILVFELDLGLGGVNVHVDGGGVYGEVEEVVGLFTFAQDVAIALHDCLVEVGVLHVAVVDEEVLQGSLFARRLGLPHKAAHGEEFVVDLHGQQLLTNGLGEERGDALAQGGGGQLQHLHVVVRQGEAHLRVGKRHVLQFGDDVAQLRLVALEKLAAGRDVEEEVAHGKVRPDGTRHLFLALHFAARQDEVRTIFVFGATRAQIHLGYGSNGGECLAAEAHGVEGKEVRRLSDLRGGVALECHVGIFGRHAAPIVDDLYQLSTCLAQHHLYVGGMRVDGIFEQLLDDRGGTLHHFAGSDLTRHGVGQQMYYIRHGSWVNAVVVTCSISFLVQEVYFKRK